MKVCFVREMVSTPQESGHTRHYSLAKFLQRQGVSTQIIASNVDYHTAQSKGEPSAESVMHSHIDGVDFTWLKTPPPKNNYLQRVWRTVIFAYRLLKYRKQLVREKPDVVIGSSPDLISTLGAYFFAKKLNAQFFLEVRDIWPQSIIDIVGVSRYNPLIMLFSCIERYLYKHAAGIITVLPDSPAYFQRFGVAAEDIVYIPNGIDFEILDKSQAKPAQKNTDAFVVMYAGSHGKANALDRIIEAAHLLQQQAPEKNIAYWFLGDGLLKNALKEQAAHYQLRNVKFFDSLPKVQAHAFMQQADAFIMTHLPDAELFQYGMSPNKLFDYMALQKPIIYAINTPHQPVLDAGCGVYADSRDPANLNQAALELLALSAQARHDMGARGYAYLAAHHDMSKLADKLSVFLTTKAKSVPI